MSRGTLVLVLLILALVLLLLGLLAAVGWINGDAVALELGGLASAVGAHLAERLP